MVDTTGPWGSVSYSPNGSQSFVGSDGKTITIPRYTQTTSLSPEQQQIYDQSQQAEINLSQLASDQSAMLQDYLGSPFEFNNQDAENWSFDLASQRILPQQQKADAALRARLINSGIREGSEAWNNAFQQQSQSNSDQLNQLALTGRNQAFSEALATRQEPLNEITALLSGSQVSNPAQMSGATPQTSVAGVDYSGLVQQNYQNKLAAQQASLGGLFGLAGSLGAGAITKWSDRRLKTDVRRVGSLENGLPLYSYRYVWGGPTEIGLMSDDVRSVSPDAVIRHPSGFDQVNYERAVSWSA